MSNSTSATVAKAVDPPIVDGRRMRIPGWSLWLAFGVGVLCVAAVTGHNLYREWRARQVLDASTFILSYELADSLPFGLEYVSQRLPSAELPERLSILRPVTELYLNDTLDAKTWQAALEICGPSIGYLGVESPNVTEAQFAELISRCPLVDLLGLDLANVSASDSWLAMLRNCQQLDTLGISQAGGVTADGLRHLASLPQLSYVSLDHVTLAAREFEQLARCPQLETVELITSTLHCGAGQTQSLPPALTVLLLTDCRFTPATLRNMTSGCSQLKVVKLTGYWITPEHLAVLTSSPALSRLELNRVEITEEYLQHLPDMTKLETLVLYGSSIDDGAVPYLEECVSLRSLDVAETRLTVEGIAELRRKLPLCTVQDESIGRCGFFE